MKKILMAFAISIGTLSSHSALADTAAYAPAGTHSELFNCWLNDEQNHNPNQVIEIYAPLGRIHTKDNNLPSTMLMRRVRSTFSPRTIKVLREEEMHLVENRRRQATYQTSSGEFTLILNKPLVAPLDTLTHDIKLITGTDVLNCEIK